MKVEQNTAITTDSKRTVDDTLVRQFSQSIRQSRRETTDNKKSDQSSSQSLLKQAASSSQESVFGLLGVGMLSDAVDYDATLNDLAARMADGLSDGNRSLSGFHGKSAEDFAKLVRGQLEGQDHPNLEKAVEQVKDDLVGRLGNALDNQGKDAKHGLDVFNGYWKRHDGKRDATTAAFDGYNAYLEANVQTSGDYDDVLDKLARALGGSADGSSRRIDHLDSSPVLGKLYQRLVQDKYDEGLSQKEAVDQVNDDLHDRIHHYGNGANIFDGYWKRHGGAEDADKLAGKVYDSKLSDNDAQGYENTLNGLAVELADGMADSLEKGDRKTLYLEGNRADEFQDLVRAQLDEQKARGLPANLNGAIQRVKSDLYARLHNALDDRGRDADEGVDIFDGYWDHHGGDRDAAHAGYDAYAQFLADNTDTHNTDYEDNLNALASGIGGSVVPGTRMIEHLDGNKTLSALYKNLIESKLKDGVDRHDAIKQVNEDLRGRLGDAAPESVKDDVLDIFDGYWSRHDGEQDANRLATDAYKTHLGIDDTDREWAAIDDSQYSDLNALKDWDGLTSGMDDKERFQTEQRLNRPLAAARLLKAHWSDWGMDKGRSFGDTEGLPPEGKAVLDYINSNPALSNALDVANGHDGHANGTIQKDDVEAFIDDTQSDIDDAADAFKDYKDDNPDAGHMTLETVRSAAILAANQQIAQSAAPADQSDNEDPADADNLTTPAGLKALKNANPDLDKSLTDAAHLWSKPGMFRNLDKAGDDYATNGFDQLFSGKNIRSWISDQAPSNDSETAAIIQSAAQVDVTADVDVSDLDDDVFKHPDQYSAKQKAAVLQHLMDLKLQIQVGDKEGYWAPLNLFAHDGPDNINPNVDKVLADIQGKIDQLGGDEDVSQFLRDNVTQEIQDLGQSDGRLHQAIQDTYENRIKTGDALKDDLQAKDEDGNTLSTEQGLLRFVNDARFFTQVMGENGKHATDFKLYEAVDNAGETQHLKQVFKDEYLSGDKLNDALDSDNPGQALQSYNQTVAAFGAALPPDYVESHFDDLKSTYSDTVLAHLLGNASKDDIDTSFADKDGNLDEDKLKKAIEKAKETNPDAFVDADGNQLDPSLIVRVFAQLFGAIQSGMGVKQAHTEWLDKINDGQLPKGFKTPDNVNPKVFRAGLVHAVSSLLTGGVLAAQAATSDQSPTSITTSVAIGTLITGAMLESSSKYAAYRIGDPFDPDNSFFKKIYKEVQSSAARGVGRIGGALGVLGNGILSGVSLFNGVEDLKNGDKAGAGLNITSGISFGFATIAGLADVSVSAAAAFGAEITGATVAAVSSVASVVGGVTAVVGGLAALGYLIYQAVEGMKKGNAFNEQIGSELSQWGITGGPIEDSDRPNDLGPVATE